MMKARKVKKVNAVNKMKQLISKKSSERKLNTNPGKESAKEYRKNSEPLKVVRKKVTFKEEKR